MATDLRRFLFRVSGNRLQFMDPQIRGPFREREEKAGLVSRPVQESA